MRTLMNILPLPPPDGTGGMQKGTSEERDFMKILLLIEVN